MLPFIPGYEIISLAGQGTFSKVYRGQKGDQVYAIKVIQSAEGEEAEKLLESLRYEFWVLKDLNHPNIVKVYDFGTLPTGEVYLVEDFLKGGSLSPFCKKRSFKECEEVFLGFLRGLVELDRWKIVHGDIKPDNLMVVLTKEGPRGILLDFGLVQGTPATMSPEVILKQTADCRSDLYSLGVSFYESLTGKNPFLGKNLDETLSNHLHKKPDSVGLTRSDVPPLWGHLIDRLLAKNRADRPSSPAKALSGLDRKSFRLSLSRFKGDRSSPFSREEMKEWLGEVFSLKKIPPLFLDQIMKTSGGIPQSAWNLLHQLADREMLADAEGRVTPSTLSLIRWDEVLSPSEFSENILTDFEWQWNWVFKRVRERRIDEDDPVWKKLEELADTSPDPMERLKRRARFLALRGEALIDQGKFDRAGDDLNTALELFRHDPRALLHQLRTRNFLAYIFLRQGKAVEAVREFESVAREVETKLTPNQAAEVTNLDLGLAYLQAGDYQKAIERLNAETKLFPDQISSLYNLAQACAALSDIPQAEAFYHKTLDQARSQRDPAYILRALNGLANLLRDGDRWREAAERYGEALEVALALKDPVSATAIAQNRGSLLARHGLYQEGIRDLEDSLKYSGKISQKYAFEKTLICRTHVELGEIETALGRWDGARDHLDRAWHLAEKDESLTDFRFWVLASRLKIWMKTGNEEDWKKELALLNYYADTDIKKEKRVELLESYRQSRTLKQPPSKVSSHLERILQINRDLVGDFSLDELFKRILGHAIELSGAELGVILLVEEKGELKPVLSLNAELDSALCDISTNIAHHVLKTGRPVNSADALEDREFNQYASVMSLHLRSILGLPIVFKGKILGVLYLSHRYQPAVFNDEIIQTLATFADQAGLALTQHQLLDYYRSTQQTLTHELEETQLNLMVTREKIRNLPEEWQERVEEGPLKTRSKKMLTILDQVDRVAESTLSITIHGETGTGKEMVARRIHEKSLRRKEPFMAINCGALPANLIESELFGHVRGAFTGADRDKIGLITAANQGTLFLDEIGDLPLEAQVRLLRVLQEREVVRVGDTRPRSVDIRLICATHRPLRQMVEEKKFREDLYYRLMGLEVTLPPLRERPEDIPLLAQFFLKETLRSAQKKIPEKLSATLNHALSRYFWPGNVRELKNLIQTGVTLCEGKILKLETLPLYWQERLTEPLNVRNRRTTGEVSVAGWYQPGKTWREHELLIYASSLVSLDFDIPRVASSLGVGIATVYKWMRDERIKDQREEWNNKIVSYQEGTQLSKIRSAIFSVVAKKFSGHPYHAARELDVSPATFYRWSRNSNLISTFV